MQQPILPESVNAIGIAAGIAFVFCWLGAGVSALAALRHQRDAPKPISLWKDPMRPFFLRFFLFCLAGVLCSIAAFAFGGWPTGYE